MNVSRFAHGDGVGVDVAGSILLPINKVGNRMNLYQTVDLTEALGGCIVLGVRADTYHQAYITIELLPDDPEWRGSVDQMRKITELVGKRVAPRDERDPRTTLSQ